MKPDDLTATTVDDPTRLDQAGETLDDIARFLWDMLTDERGGPSTIEVVNDNPYTALAAAGHEDVSREEFLEALDRIALQLDSNHSTEIESLRQSVLHLPSPAPHVTNVTHVTRRNVVQATEDHRVSVVNNNIDNTTTTVDNRVITEINARGDVDFDLDVENDTTIADDGGVAVNGNLEDSTVNTGVNTGIIAGDDVGVEDSIIGDDNLQVNDTEAEAFAVGGDATSVEADNANLGSGELVDAGPSTTASLLAEPEPEPEFEELPMAEPEPEMLAEEEPFVDTSADDGLFPEDEDLNL